MKFIITYKPDSERPATMSGRELARPETFKTREAGEKFLVKHQQDKFLQIVESLEP